MTHIRTIPIVLTLVPEPYMIQQLNLNIHPPKLPRVGPAPGPINPRNRPIRIQTPVQNIHQRRQVMLVVVARRAAEVAEYAVILGVGDDGEGEGAVELEPLGALAPLLDGYVGPHAGVVAAPTHFAWVVEGAQEAVVGAHEVGVGGGEVDDGDA